MPTFLSRRSIWPYVILATIALVTLCPCARNGFLTWDDPDTIARNPDFTPAVTSATFVRAWTQPQGDLYVPVTYSVWGMLATIARVEAGADGIALSPVVYHGLNLLLHAGSTLLVYALLRRLTDKPWASLLGAALFAVHPVQVETVAWASGTKDLLAGMFSLAALNLYVRSIGPAPTMRQIRPYLLATACFILALLSKPSVVAWPLAAGVIAGLLLNRPWRAAMIDMTPWLLLSLPIVAIGRWAQPAHMLPYVPPLPLRPLIALDAIGFYLPHLLFPISLCVDYGRSPQFVLHAPSTILNVAVAVVAAALIFRFRRSRALLAGSAIFAAALLPVLGLAPFDFQQYSTTSDHYLYLAIVGVCLLAAYWLPSVYALSLFLRRRSVMLVIAALIVLAIRAFAQTWYWADSGTLFAQTLKVNPDSPAARVNLAIALTEQGRLKEAAGHYEALLARDPANAKAHLGLGQVLARSNDPRGGIEHLRAAISLQPENPLPHYNLGLLLASQGQAEEAVTEYERAIALEPGFAEAHTNLATLLLSRGDLEGAEKHYRRAIAIRPGLSLPRRGLEAIEQMRSRGPATGR